jgi:hypothetical protein
MAALMAEIVVASMAELDGGANAVAVGKAGARGEGGDGGDIHTLSLSLRGIRGK